MIVVTGAAGFIGSHIVKSLNDIGVTDVLAVDNLSNGHQFSNLTAVRCLDYIDSEDFLDHVRDGLLYKESVKAVFHQGACSDTTEWDGRYMMKNNYEYTKILFHHCLESKVPFLYASSAAVYGCNTIFKEADLNQKPLNVYGYSKWQFDQYLMHHLCEAESQVVGLRYFNVYGPREQHKGKMASVALHFMEQLFNEGVVHLFEGTHGYSNGEQRRDFVFIDDVVKINLWFLQHCNKSGIFNVGTGRSHSFNDVARVLIQCHGRGEVRYISFPDELRKVYQARTEADISALREAGYDATLTSLEEGLNFYYQWFSQQQQIA